MKTYESSAKTIEEAISAGLEKLGVSISDVTIDVLEEGSKGLFGLFGSRQAKVRLTLKETEADPLEALTAAKPARSAAQHDAVRDHDERAGTDECEACLCRGAGREGCGKLRL